MLLLDRELPGTGTPRAPFVAPSVFDAAPKVSFTSGTPPSFLVLSAGAYRSGSTWLHYAVVEVLEYLGWRAQHEKNGDISGKVVIPDARIFHVAFCDVHWGKARQCHVRAAVTPRFVMKVHHFDERLVPLADVIVTSHRDVRDVFASSMQKVREDGSLFVLRAVVLAS